MLATLKPSLYFSIGPSGDGSLVKTEVGWLPIEVRFKPRSKVTTSQRSARLGSTFYDDVVRPWTDSTKAVAKMKSRPSLPEVHSHPVRGPLILMSDRTGLTELRQHGSTDALRTTVLTVFMSVNSFRAVWNVAESEVDRERPRLGSWFFRSAKPTCRLKRRFLLLR
jgi:hypothetical protein